MKNWKPNSWRTKTGKHLPVYENENKLNEVLKEISKFPPLVLLESLELLNKCLAK